MRMPFDVQARIAALLAACLIALWSEPALGGSGQPTRRPNVILILADDLGYGDPGCYGGTAKTPNLDRLARQGMRFTDFHSNGPMCSPTRAALLTGRYQQRMGIENALSETASGLPRSERTVAQYLQEAGYATAMYGKWHLGPRPEEGPNRFGFQDFRGGLHGSMDYQSHVTRSGRGDWWHNETLERESGYITTLITAHAVEFIRSHREQPFFLYVAHSAIHFPWMTPDDPPHHAPGEDNSDLKKLGPHKPNEVGAVVQAMIESLDQGVGKILDTLAELDLDQETFVFFFSDNGGYLEYQGGFTDISSNGALRGQKGDVYEGGHRVAAIARWTGQILPNSVTDATAISMDLLPTLLELAGAGPPPGTGPHAVDGTSLAPLLLHSQTLPSRTLFWRISGRKAVRSGSWKLVVMPGKKPELYNLADDLGETRDLAAQQPERMRSLQAELASWEERVDPKEPSRTPP